MPYIKKEDQPYLQFEIPETPGQLNWMFSVISKSYWQKNQKYQTINDILGALEGAKQEFYRRVAVPYENQKIKDNGDVY